MLSDGQGLEQSIKLVLGDFGLKTRFTGLDIPDDVFLYLQPKVSAGDELKSLMYF